MEEIITEEKRAVSNLKGQGEWNGKEKPCRESKRAEKFLIDRDGKGKEIGMCKAFDFQSDAGHFVSGTDVSAV